MFSKASNQDLCVGSLFQPAIPSLFPAGSSRPLRVSSSSRHPPVPSTLLKCQPDPTGEQSPGFKMGTSFATNMNFYFNIKYTSAQFHCVLRKDPQEYKLHSHRFP